MSINIKSFSDTIKTSDRTSLYKLTKKEAKGKLSRLTAELLFKDFSELENDLQYRDKFLFVVEMLLWQSLNKPGKQEKLFEQDFYKRLKQLFASDERS